MIAVAKTGKELLRATKESASSADRAERLPVGRPSVASLRPVATRPGTIPREDVRVLTEWRNRFVESFLTEFVATEERTERWLADSVGPDDTRILFMIDDAEERTIGYVGLAFIDWETGEAEADAIVRGVDGPRGLIAQSLEAMWRWGHDALGLSMLGVRVRSDNPAIGFYKKAGFRERRRVPLRRERNAQGVEWVEDPDLADGNVSLVYLELEDLGD